MKSKHNSLHRQYPIWYIIPALTLFMMFFILPNLSSFVFSFTDWSIFRLYHIQFIGLDNFARLLQEVAFKSAVFNTLYFAIITTLVKNVFGLILALAVCTNTRFSNFFRSVFFIPVTISTLVVAMIFVAIYNPDHGVLNTVLRTIGLNVFAQNWLVDVKYAMTSICFMEIWQWTGYSMIIYVTGLKSVSRDYYEAVKIDGANWFQTLHKLTLPMIMPSINVSLMMTVIGGFKVFAQVYATTNGGPINSTQVFGTFIYKTFSDGFLGYSSAVGMIMTVVLLIITLFFLPKLRRMEVEN